MTAKIRNIGSGTKMLKILTTESALKGLLNDELAVGIAVGQMLQHFGPKMPALNRAYLGNEGREMCLLGIWEVLDAVFDHIESGICPMTKKVCPRD